MSGGSGEAASAGAGAGAAQLLAEMGRPSTVSAGMTDATTPDAQAGYEKGYSVALSNHAGADMINLSVGMLGLMMVASRGSLVIDDDMCGAILRSVRGIEVSADALDIEAVERVVSGGGHYLGEAQTLKLMTTEYTYPTLADRASVNDWLLSGAPSLWNKASARVAEILAQPQSEHLSSLAERNIRERFPVQLSTFEDG